MVLADGNITNANLGQNKDLFWALKGGGPNFGIVTRFDLYTIPVGVIWYKVTVHSLEQAFEIFDAFVQWQNEWSSDIKSTAIIGVTLDSISLGLVYSAPLQKRPEVFAMFDNIEPLVTAVPPTNGTPSSLTAISGSAVISDSPR